MIEHHLTYETQPDPMMDAWDAVPRDGPAIFIATCIDDRPVAGAWVTANQPEPYFLAELAFLLHEPLDARERREWVVLDQVGIAEPMLPERLNLAGLYQTLHRWSREAAS